MNLTDDQIFELLENMEDAPRLVIGRAKYVHLGDVILEWRRIGQGQRWELSPSSGIIPANQVRAWWPREVRTWASRYEGLDIATHARAMGARVL